MIGGRVVVTRGLFFGLASGATTVQAASLTLIECIIQDCHAEYGSAVLVATGSVVRVENSVVTNNSATVSGGALHVGGSSNVTLEHSAFTFLPAFSWESALYPVLKLSARFPLGARRSMTDTIFEKNSAP
jgi:predicted outer membrane repeat protein